MAITNAYSYAFLKADSPIRMVLVTILLIVLSIHLTLALSSEYPSIIKVRVDGLDSVESSVVVTQILLFATIKAETGFCVSDIPLPNPEILHDTPSVVHINCRFCPMQTRTTPFGLRATVGWDTEYALWVSAAVSSETLP